MTVQTTTKRADYTGNGVTTTFTVPFYFLDDADLKVLLTNLSTGAVTTLVLASDYTVAGAGVTLGGSITLTSIVPTSSQRISILRDLSLTQLTHYVEGDPFPARSHENALDLATMGLQQLAEVSDRTVTLPENVGAGVSTALPSPEPNKFFGWNSTATALQNYDLISMVTVAAYGTTQVDTATGNGSTKDFTLSRNPGALFNLDVSVGGVVQTPTADFTWDGNLKLSFVTAPPSGATILVRYTLALPQGQTLASLVFDSLFGVTRTQADINLDRHSVKSFGAKGDGVTDDTVAIQTYINWLSNTGQREAYFPAGTYLYSRIYCYYDAIYNPGFNPGRDARVTLVGDGRSSPHKSSVCGTILRCTSSSGDGFVVSPASLDASPYPSTEFSARRISFEGANSGFLVVAMGVAEPYFEDCQFVQWNTAGSGINISSAWFALFRRCKWMVAPYGASSTGTAIQLGDSVVGGGGLFTLDGNCNIAGYAIGIDIVSGSWQQLSVENTEVAANTYGIRAQVYVQMLNLHNAYFEGGATSFIKDVGASCIAGLSISGGTWFHMKFLSGPAIDLYAPRMVNIRDSFVQDPLGAFLNIANIASTGLQQAYSVSNVTFVSFVNPGSQKYLFTGIIPALYGVDYDETTPNLALFDTSVAYKNHPLRSYIDGSSRGFWFAANYCETNIKNYGAVSGGSIDIQGDGFPSFVYASCSGTTTPINLPPISSGVPHGFTITVTNDAGATQVLTVKRNVADGGTTLGTIAAGAQRKFIFFNKGGTTGWY